MEEKFLPIGSVVLLKGGERELMITGYCLMPNGEVIEDGKTVTPEANTIYEYGACLYPDGIVDPNQICCFNHENIDKVIFEGYKDDKYESYVDTLKGGLARYKEKLAKSSSNEETEEYL